MADYSEEEQVEIIRKWWMENGVSVVVAIVLAVAALLGWRHWQNSQKVQAAAASTLYQQMLVAVDAARQRPDSEKEALTVKLSAEKLVEQYPDTAYGDYAQLMLAKLAVEDQNYELAATQLQEVIDAPASEVIKWTAVMRLARLQVQTAAYDDALKLVTGKVPAAYMGQALEIKGDVLRAQEDVAGAREAYTLAMEKMDGDNHKELVRMKLQDLAPAS